MGVGAWPVRAVVDRRSFFEPRQKTFDNGASLPYIESVDGDGRQTREGRTMDKAQLQEWIKGEYEALKLSAEQRAEVRGQIVRLIGRTHGATMSGHKRAIREMIFAPIREAQAAQEAARQEDLRQRAREAAAQMPTPLMRAEEDEAIERAVRAWEAQIARRNRMAA